MAKFFLVPAPGYYGDRARALSSHGTLAAACKRKGRDSSVVIREGSKSRGDTWLRSSENVYRKVDC